MISVIVPVFNASRWIGNCIESLLDQNYDSSEYEIVVVDNNSSDDSRSRITRDWHVRLLEETIQGSYAARNRGVAESRGEWLAFTDADCVADRNWLASIQAAMRNARTQVVLGSRAAISESGTAGLLAAYDDARVRYILENRRKRSYFAFTNNMAVRRSAFERYGPFHTAARGSDTLFLRRLTDGEGPQAVEWSAEMRVRHLEMRGAWTYIRKNFIYARARRRTEHLGQCETLQPAESLEIFRKVCRGRSVADKIALALALSTGRLSWAAGSLRVNP
ncbi:MAG TPA: glycosyltransferase family 2 protein [Bryobacteraceae bacterium]|nr:glycosyltransferase family 2 protein [Bryobacteraceae bacterium]